MLFFVNPFVSFAPLWLNLSFLLDCCPGAGLARPTDFEITATVRPGARQDAKVFCFFSSEKKNLSCF
jgi:hypothetical protein